MAERDSLPRREGSIVTGEDGRQFEIVGPMVSYSGKEGCRDPRCTRRGDQCVGHHCGHCDAPTSMYGHFTHVAWWEPNDNPGSIGTGVKFPDGAGYFSCSAEYEQAVAALKEVRDAA